MYVCLRTLSIYQLTLYARLRKCNLITLHGNLILLFEVSKETTLNTLMRARDQKYFRK